MLFCSKKVTISDPPPGHVWIAKMIILDRFWDDFGTILARFLWNRIKSYFYSDQVIICSAADPAPAGRPKGGSAGGGENDVLQGENDSKWLDPRGIFEPAGSSHQFFRKVMDFVRRQPGVPPGSQKAAHLWLPMEPLWGSPLARF